MEATEEKKGCETRKCRCICHTHQPGRATMGWTVTRSPVALDSSFSSQRALSLACPAARAS